MEYTFKKYDAIKMLELKVLHVDDLLKSRAGDNKQILVNANFYPNAIFKTYVGLFIIVN